MEALLLLFLSWFNWFIAIICFKNPTPASQFWGWANLACSAFNAASFMAKIF